MGRYWIVFVFVLLAAPLPSALGAADMQGPQSVEEPDMPDEGDEAMPENEPSPPAAKPGKKAEQPDQGGSNYDTVLLQGLNKVTARASGLEAHIGSPVRFGTLAITARSCWKSSPEDRPENAALLEISEMREGEAAKPLFSGWMFSSSPALSSLENPFYDVTVLACKNARAKK